MNFSKGNILTQGIPGVYMIVNNVTKSYYIGSSYNVHKRRVSHLCNLNKCKHHNRRLQLAFNKYGVNSFSFYIVQLCTVDKLQESEQLWLNEFIDKNHCYNLFKTAYAVHGEDHHMYGKSHTPEARLKIKYARAKQVISHSDDTRKKMSINHARCKMKPGQLEKMIAARSGKAWNKGLKTGIKPANTISFTEDQKAEILALYQQGKSIEHIRKHLSVSWGAIKNFLFTNQVQTRTIKEQKKLNDRSN